MMKYISTSICFLLAVSSIAQNVGINNTDPKSALDVNGGLRLRPITSLVSGTTVTLVSNHGYHFVSGTPTGNFTISLLPLPSEGQHTIITNTTGFTGNVFSIAIPPATTVELFYSNGGWKQIGSSQSVAAGWALNGNAGTTGANYIGTSDAQPLRFRANGTPAAIFDNAKFNYHIGVGYPMSAAYTGFRNVSIGYFNGFSYTTASHNVSFGDFALSSATEGSGNVAIGNSTLRLNKTGSSNIAIGEYALFSDTATNGAIAIGYAALRNNVNRGGNIAVGYAALENNSKTSSIVASEGINNIALGSLTLHNNKRGSGAVAIGSYAAFSDTAAEGIVAIGRGALFNNNGNMGNLAIGDSSLYNNGTGAVDAEAFGNVAVGSKALFSNTKGRSNTGLGVNVLNKNTTGGGNTAIGGGTLANSNGNSNTGVGNNSLLNNTSGSANTALGTFTLATNSTGNSNTAVGYGSLLSNTLGYSNVAVGVDALKLNTTLSNLVAIGDSALFNAGLVGSNGFGKYNTAIGSKALFNVVGADINTAVGYNALKQTNGSGNTAIGAFAGTYVNGSSNTIIGSQNQTYTIPKSISGSVFIGLDAGLFESTSNKLYIENSDANKNNALIYGDFAADSILLNAKTVVRNNAVVGGFTKLGGYDTDVPSIKTKKLVVTSSASSTGFSSINHGLTASKILSVTTLLEWTAGFFAPTEYSPDPLLRYNYFISPTQITIQNNAATCAYICSKQVKIMITYEE